MIGKEGRLPPCEVAPFLTIPIKVENGGEGKEENVGGGGGWRRKRYWSSLNPDQ